MKKLQNDLIAIDRQLIKNDRSKHELLSLIPDITNIKVSLIVINVIPASIILILTNITIISRNSHTDIILNIVLNATNIDHTDTYLTVIKISSLVMTSAQDEITLIVLSMHDRLEINTTLRLS